MLESPYATIVVVDDEPSIVDVVFDALQDEGFEMVGCSQSREAFRCIRQHRPRLVMLDIQMPNVNGIELFLQLRAEPNTAHTPVIFFTANHHILEQRLPNYRQLGVDVLPKPFAISQLFDTVNKSLS